MAFINIGFGNIINTDKVVSIVTPDSAPAKRLVQRAKEEGNIIDATQDAAPEESSLQTNTSCFPRFCRTRSRQDPKKQQQKRRRLMFYDKEGNDHCFIWFFRRR